jgi:hypothetical protein
MMGGSRPSTTCGAQGAVRVATPKRLESRNAECRYAGRKATLPSKGQALSPALVQRFVEKPGYDTRVLQPGRPAPGGRPSGVALAHCQGTPAARGDQEELLEGRMLARRTAALLFVLQPLRFGSWAQPATRTLECASPVS